MNETGSGTKNAVWDPETGPFYLAKGDFCSTEVLLRFYSGSTEEGRDSPRAGGRGSRQMLCLNYLNNEAGLSEF